MGDLWMVGKSVESGIQKLREKKIVHFVQKKRMRHGNQVKWNGKIVKEWEVLIPMITL